MPVIGLVGILRLEIALPKVELDLLEIRLERVFLLFFFNPINPTRKKDDPVNAINVLYDSF